MGQGSRGVGRGHFPAEKGSGRRLPLPWFCKMLSEILCRGVKIGRKKKGRLSVSPSQPTRGSGGASWAHPTSCGTKSQPNTDFSAFQASQNVFRWDVSNISDRAFGEFRGEGAPVRPAPSKYAPPTTVPGWTVSTTLCSILLNRHRFNHGIIEWAVLQCRVRLYACVCENSGHFEYTFSSCEWLFHIGNFSFMVQICERLLLKFVSHSLYVNYAVVHCTL